MKIKRLLFKMKKVIKLLVQLIVVNDIMNMFNM
nr:MAG TPA: hypothetical protein [Caudoviricetes sp.]